MKIFIRAASCISAQYTFNHQLFFTKPKEYTNNFLGVIEPNYKNIIDAKLMRRMSKVVRIGTATAMACLKEANETNVDAIVTGTAYGCMEDSENFLKKIVVQHEQMLSPTPFIQSTHNTVGSQIALMLKCHSYNNTYVHRGASFEYALIDSLLLLKENKAKLVLTGAGDEITDISFSVLKRFGLYKQSTVSNLNLYHSISKGTIAGEGMAFFLLSDQPSGSDYASIDVVEISSGNFEARAMKKSTEQFLSAHKISLNEIDLIITGKNGDVRNDTVFSQLQEDIFKGKKMINYKHLCGEYPTSTSFAVWLAANVIKQQRLPKAFEDENSDPGKFKRILICNNYLGRFYSLIMLSSCN